MAFCDSMNQMAILPSILLIDLYFTGYYCVNETVTPTACPTGHYCPQNTGFDTEFPCPKGTFNNQTEATEEASCLQCSPGYYCHGQGNTVSHATFTIIRAHELYTF